MAPEDCLPGQSCTDGTCVAAGQPPAGVDAGGSERDLGAGDPVDSGREQPPCAEHGDCPQGRVCADGVCELGECVVDEDCDANERCGDERRCEPEPECEADEQCPDGERCEAQRCVPEGPQCPEDADCDGLSCGLDPVCGAPCGECTPPDRCQEGACVCEPQCGEAECGPDPVCGQPCGMCGEDQRCEGGRCVCKPDCEQRGCGPDPVCGLSCGECADDQRCDEQGRCQPLGAAHPCDDPTLLDGLGEHLGSNVGVGALEEGSCGGAGGAEVAYRFVPGEDGPLRIATGGSEYDTVLYVRESCRDAASELACNDDSEDLGLQSALVVQARAGVALWIFVDAYGPREQGEHRVVVDTNVEPECPRDAACEGLQ